MSDEQTPVRLQSQTSERREVLVRVAGVTKAFGATQALRGASFELFAGEVHALVGENGSGKSTLVKILSGVHQRDSGSIELGGTSIRSLKTPRAAQQLGIATVFQEILVAEARSVLDNVWLGVDRSLRDRVPPDEKRRRAAEMLVELLGYPLDLDTPVETLSLSDRQACCIARALLRQPRVLILDEATSALDIATRRRLFRIMATLRAAGAAMIFTSHRMDEISEIGDRITVMRSGETVGELAQGKWAPRDLIRLMTGSEQLTGRSRAIPDRADVARIAPLMTADRIRLRPGAEPFDVAIHRGELVGLAGLEGHGQDVFLDALRGVGGFSGEVRYHAPERAIAITSISDAAANGIVYVPRERKQAIFSWMSMRENFGMPTLRHDTRFGWLRISSMRRRFDDYANQLSLVFRNREDRITVLSGGNQQKVIIARWLASNPHVLLFNDPTRGIDIGTKHDLYKLLSDLADKGAAVVMLSTELDEHVELMDRVLVFREHELCRDIPKSDLTREAIVSAFFEKPGLPLDTH